MCIIRYLASYWCVVIFRSELSRYWLPKRMATKWSRMLLTSPRCFGMSSPSNRVPLGVTESS